MLNFPFKKRRKVKVGEILLQLGLINQAQLTGALALQQQTHDKLGEILIQQGVVTHAQLKQALAEQYWRNVMATLLISVSTLVPHLPKVALNDSVIVQTPNQSPHSWRPELDAIGGPDSLTTAVTSNFAAVRSPHNSPSSDLAPLAAKPTATSPLNGFCHPLNGLGWLSQGNNGTTHQGRMQYAYDLASSIGTPVYAMRPGRVIGLQDKYPDTGGGREKISQFNYVFLEHDGGYRSVYVHLQQNFRSTVSIKAGDWVEAGELIGYSGNSGWSSGPHLHLEVQAPGSPKRFTHSVPFAIKGNCNSGQLAKK